MEAVLRAKMRVQSVTHTKDNDGKTESENLTLHAVYSYDPGSENAKWSKWTPCGQLTLQINNPDAIGKVSRGHEFYVDLIPVSETKHAAAETKAAV